MTTKSNIVYIGDAVHEVILVDGAFAPDAEFVTSGDGEGISTNTGDSAEFRLEYFCTPDGKPVTGFGGAGIGCSEVTCAQCTGLTPSVQGLPLQCSNSKEDAIQQALTYADALYGPWQRPYTEADLKRRGLLGEDQ